MLLRMIYDDKLAQAAWLVGCQKTGEAIVFDPERDVDRYLAAAAKEGLRLVACAETHIHADFLSGARELVEKHGCRAALSAEGGPEWKYKWADGRTTLLKNGDTFSVGNIDFRAMHTPGHTPEHLCYVVTDRGAGATEPMGIVTGDFLFVGDVGRPDLLETAAGQAGAKEVGARELFRSLRLLAELPDYVQVWPGHGAGSACGKALGAVPQTTVGYEKRFNGAVRAALSGSEESFSKMILAGQPAPPLYFARMKRENRDGPVVLGGLPKPKELSAQELDAVEGAAVVVVDTRSWKDFRAGHLPGSLFIPLDSGFPGVAGSYVRAEQDIVLVVAPNRAEEAVRDCVRIGLDRIVGWAGPETVARARGLETIGEIDVAELAARLAQGGATVLDVRRTDEWAEGHIEGAVQVTHTDLPGQLARVPRGRPVLVHCRSGARSARAAALLRREGYDAVNVAGGYLAWEKAARGG